MNTRVMSKRMEIDERMALFLVTSLERIEGGQGGEDLVRFGGKAQEGVKKETERRAVLALVYYCWRRSRATKLIITQECGMFHALAVNIL